MVDRQKQNFLPADIERKKSIERLELACSAVGIGIWELDLATNNLIWDQQVFSLFGITSGRYANSHEAWVHTVHPEDRFATERKLEESFRKGLDYDDEFRVIWPDGSVHVIHSSAKMQRDRDDHVTSLVGINHDITERVNIEITLKESENRFRAIFEQAAVGVALLHTRSGRFIRLNNKYCEILGYSEEELLKKTFMDITHPDDIQKNVENNTRMIEGLARETFLEKRFIQKDGKILWAKVTISPLWKNTEAPKEYFHIGILENINDRKLAEEKICKLLEEKDILLKEVHHRIKNNMNTISSLLNLQASTVKDPVAVNAIKVTDERVKSMMMLYEKLYQSKNISSLSVKAYVGPLVSQILYNYPGHESVKVVEKIEDFELDAGLLQPLGIIVNELVSNTMKYAFEKDAEKVITVLASKAGSKVTFSIQDNGQGIPDSVNLENSSGFGLVLVNGLARQLNGYIKMERNNGTKVTLEFDA